MLTIFTKAMALVSVAGGLTLVVVAPASAQTSDPAVGRLCGFTSATSGPIPEERTGWLTGGPLVATMPGATISMECTIQVGAANSTHAGPEICSAASSPSLQATAIAPSLSNFCTYRVDDEPIYTCTKAIVDEVEFFWESTVDPATGEASGRWATDPNAKCYEWMSRELGDSVTGKLCPFSSLLPDVPGIIDIGPDGDLYLAGVWLVDCWPYDNPEDGPTGPFFPDPLVCPILIDHAGTHGPVIVEGDGDVYVDVDLDGAADPDEWFWNCPPYTS